MNIVEPYARMIEVPDREAGITLLRKVEFCARVSHASEDAQTPDSWERFLTAVVMNHGDWSVTEHASVTVDMVLDRAIAMEVRTHRIGSYTQSSTRFINYVKKMPPSYVCPYRKGIDAEEKIKLWYEQIERAEATYRALIELGDTPQIARSVLPHALSARIYVTYDLRSWRHFFLMRTTKQAHPQLRKVSVPLLKQFQETIPLLYQDIEPEATQRENMRKPK